MDNVKSAADLCPEVNLFQTLRNYDIKMLFNIISHLCSGFPNAFYPFRFLN
jgi:hypothetical protein